MKKYRRSGQEHHRHQGIMTAEHATFLFTSRVLPADWDTRSSFSCHLPNVYLFIIYLFSYSFYAIRTLASVN